MKEQTEKALVSWLSNFPDSYHPCDMKRFYEMLEIAGDNDDLYDLIASDLSHYVNTLQPDWCEEKISEFVSEWVKSISLCAHLILWQKGIE